MNTTFVLVHGASSNAQSWVPLQQELALLGHRSLALDLPGHGAARQPAAYYRNPQDLAELAEAPSPMAGIDLADNVEHVVDAVRRVAEHGPVVLVGASMGGVTISAVGNEIPELLNRIVYLSAWCGATTRTMAEFSTSPEHATNLLDDAAPSAVIGDPEALGAARINWRGASGALFAELKAAMMADGTDEEFRALLNTLDPDETMAPATADSQLRAETWGRVPHSYVRFTEDRSIPIAMQDRMIAEADELTPDNPFDVHSIDGSHVCFFNRAREVAATLARLA
ncbi:Alpha/beta hydrolase family protein [Saccharopolyspora kobensis]|uniref:Alpha/beta hydrolase family protein n=1 Tax=Saccharopolyspora kobensis TaxID=146035 RepID=A0A1H5TVE3_9PSEU|nr:alpha/beta hydrolase [Saccharopolyspora kobensis]SEF66178.1 Alpha/beta hydrolase family protein [Saccharopolyspora kobensis]SFC42523.1 Alpha/beta hydrolase family protein [Saccharopolyspora kobensis]